MLSEDLLLFLPFAALFGLCWGSFLNVVAHRLLCGGSPFTGRSHCPACTNTIAWYDLIPLLSWLALRGRCRTCRSHISWLYPFIEGITALSCAGIVSFIHPHYWPATLFYLSALIVTVRTDITELIIMRQTTLLIMPLAPLAAYYGFIPISLYNSLLGCIAGAGFLALTSLIFWLITKKIGLGQGDIELCGLIGGFTGILGWWFSLLVGSILGTTVGLIALINSSKNQANNPFKLPFGAFLAIGSIIFTIFQSPIQALFTKLLLVV